MWHSIPWLPLLHFPAWWPCAARGWQTRQMRASAEPRKGLWNCVPHAIGLTASPLISSLTALRCSFGYSYSSRFAVPLSQGLAVISYKGPDEMFQALRALWSLATTQLCVGAREQTAQVCPHRLWHDRHLPASVFPACPLSLGTPALGGDLSASAVWMFCGLAFCCGGPSQAQKGVKQPPWPPPTGCCQTPPLSCDNQECLQPLPDVPQGTKSYLIQSQSCNVT